MKAALHWLWSSIRAWWRWVLKWLLRTYYALLAAVLGAGCLLGFVVIRYVIIPLARWLQALWGYLRGRKRLDEVPGSEAADTPLPSWHGPEGTGGGKRRIPEASGSIRKIPRRRNVDVKGGRHRNKNRSNGGEFPLENYRPFPPSDFLLGTIKGGRRMRAIVIRERVC